MYVVNITEDSIDILCVIKKKNEFVDEIYLYLIISVDLKSVHSYSLSSGFHFPVWDSQ